MAKHVNEDHHLMNYEAISVLDTATHYKKRTFLEMVRISQEAKAMNSRKDIDGLSNIYVNLIQLDLQLRSSSHNRQNNDADETPDISVILDGQ